MTRGLQRNRAPQPGLVNLGLPLPSVPVLSPLLSPVVDSTSQSSPAPPPQQNTPGSQAPPSPPPQSDPGHNPHADGSNGNKANPHSSGGKQQGDSGSPAGSGPDNGSVPATGTDTSPQNTPQSGPSGSIPSAGTPPPADTPISVISGSTFLVTPTGLVTNPADDAVSNAVQSSSNSDTKPGDPASQSNPSGSGASASTQLGFSATSAGSLGSIPTTARGSNGATIDGGGSSGEGGTAASATSSQNRISAGAVGGIVVGVLLACIVLALVILRNRYKRRKDERHVEWISGYVGGSASGPAMLQRNNSKRSSWGTPVEYRHSNPFRQSFASSQSHSDDQDHNYVITAPSLDYEHSYSVPPILPMPVHSPTQLHVYNPEDPFADGSAQPLRRMSSLPLRVSVISSASGHEDPFADQKAPLENLYTQGGTPEASVPPASTSSSATFGHGTRGIVFPAPPPSPGSTLQTPGILISFPDSPISPSFAASGTSSYPRHATAQASFVPSEKRRDELRVDRGEIVSVISVYEDGWAFIQRVRDNERGLVPLSHLAM